MFTTLLIANRGEIACRVVRTARRMGIRTVAVYSDADASAQHVKAADQAVHIGGAAARDSYLSIDRILRAARDTDAQAIHPGYGFLSENPAFAEACERAGITFVGPPAAAMRAMGLKSAAKALMESHGVPVLPGYHGDNQDSGFLADQAARIGYPVAIKAVAGGGGRGLRVVHTAIEFPAALASAQQEGASSFGDDRVLIERYLGRPRHIEVQVFADSHGNAVHLFERDCSAQRRHQKVIEEAPAPGLSPADRAAMGDAAVRAAQAVGYRGAGTVEFIVDGRGFAFLEMNTRLQVEHPVTEMITGFDLVEWQLLIAAGAPLPATQDDITISGHAFEARLYAEDPARDFAPSVGHLALFHTPSPGFDTRIDSGVISGDSIGIHYDAMLAKIICHGPDRPAALRTLRRALDACRITGLTSNLDLLGRIARHPEFMAGGIDTGFIMREAPNLLADTAGASAEQWAMLALAELLREAHGAESEAASDADPYSPWHARDGWWVNADPDRVLVFEHGDQAFAVKVRARGADWLITVAERSFIGHAAHGPDGLIVATLNGQRQSIAVDTNGLERVLRQDGLTWRVRVPDPHAYDEDDAGGSDRLIAPIPGQVTQVIAQEGLSVTRGQTLVVLEAMKTVFRLPAPGDRIVQAVSCAVGDMVQDGQVLVSFVPIEA